LTDEKLHQIDVKLAEYNANLSNLVKDFSEMKALLAPIQKHVTQVQTGMKIAKWVSGTGLIGGLIAAVVKWV